MRYAACADADYNATTGECAQVVFTEMPSLLPNLTVAEGLQISAAILAVMGLAYAGKLVSRAIRST